MLETNLEDEICCFQTSIQTIIADIVVFFKNISTWIVQYSYTEQSIIFSFSYVFEYAYFCITM